MDNQRNQNVSKSNSPQQAPLEAAVSTSAQLHSTGVVLQFFSHVVGALVEVEGQMILLEGWSFWIILTQVTICRQLPGTERLGPHPAAVGHRLSPSLAFGANLPR